MKVPNTEFWKTVLKIVVTVATAILGVIGGAIGAQTLM